MGQGFGVRMGERFIVVNLDKKEYFRIPPSKYENQVR